MDYCYDPNWDNSVIETTEAQNENYTFITTEEESENHTIITTADDGLTELVNLGWLPYGNQSNETLSECQGDCDADDDCDGSMLCYHNGVPPGCTNTGAYTSGMDYCYDPNWDNSVIETTEAQNENYTFITTEEAEYGISSTEDDDDADGTVMLYEPDAFQPSQSSIIGYIDVVDQMHIEMNVTIHSFGSGWSNILHCSTTNTDYSRVPGIWINPHVNGFLVKFSNQDSWDYGPHVGGRPVVGSSYHLELTVNQ